MKRRPSGETAPARAEIGGILVDLSALLSIAHRCRPEQCRARHFCCAHYEVCISGRELRQIVGNMPAAAELCPGLRARGGLLNVFDEVESDLYAIDTDDSDLCVFAYRDSGRQIRCALHTVAATRNLPLNAVKPRACILWPLALAGEAPVSLTVQSDAFRFPCNHRRRTLQRRLDPGIAESIRAAFGEPFLVKVREAISE